MESFGLFQILQNLLTPPTPSSQGTSPQNTPPSPPVERVETPKNYPMQEVEKRNPAVDFLENHRKRSERIKR